MAAGGGGERGGGKEARPKCTQARQGMWVKLVGDTPMPHTPSKGGAPTRPYGVLASWNEGPVA